MIDSHHYLAQLQSLSNKTLKTKKISNKNISEMRDLITAVINNPTSLKSFYRTEQIHCVINSANYIACFGKYKNKAIKIRRINELYELINESVRQGKLPDRASDYPDYREKDISSKTKIISRGIGEKTALNEEIMRSLLQAFGAVTDAIEMINVNRDHAIHIIEHIVGFRLNKIYKENELILDVLDKFMQLKKLMAGSIERKGRNITIYENNDKVKALACVMNNDFYRRVFIGTKFCSLTSVMKIDTILHEFTHLLGSCDFLYLPTPDSSFTDGVMAMRILTHHSESAFNNLTVDYLHERERPIFRIWSGMATIEEAVEKFRSDDDFRATITFNNADTLALMVIALHYEFINFKEKTFAVVSPTNSAVSTAINSRVSGTPVQSSS